MILAASPGINYGNGFFDLGLAFTNSAAYNFTNSQMINDTERLQAHVMYNGYIDSYGFFDKSKFSTLVRSQFKR
jgi:hypothetical protein